jgi:hypothetical protein
MAFFVPMLAAIGGGSAMAGGAMLASTALTVAGQVQSSRAQSAAASANAAMQRQEADSARAIGSARQEAQRRRARELLGEQRAAIGQAGIGWGGSAQDVLEQSAATAELDTMNIGYESELQARGLMSRANISEFEGKQAKKAGMLRAGTTLLGSVANYGGKSLMS